MTKRTHDDDALLREVFHEIEPPPGGLHGLRTRLIDDAERAHKRRWGLAAVPALAVVLVCVVWGVWLNARTGPTPHVAGRSTVVVVVPTDTASAASVQDERALVRLAAFERESPTAVSIGIGERGRWALEPVEESDAVVFYRVGGLD